MKISSNSPLSAATLHILLALASEDLHGYGIIQEIARQSQGSYRVGPGTLYDNLKKLMDQKLVIDVPRSALPKDEERRFYRITSSGREVLGEEVERLREVVTTAQSRLRERRPRNA
ncbi:MAG TPA: helix-turn-helix transcriptional regulator [Edaphobacter sp.]|jgi:DNA-binding PadR family transcriptional regulator|nr:helix-turn-helix transcriptional regulator [Edaphobacter sp.]